MSSTYWCPALQERIHKGTFLPGGHGGDQKTGGSAGRYRCSETIQQEAEGTFTETRRRDQRTAEENLGLMYELKKRDKSPNEVPLGDRLCAVIKKELHVDAIAKNPFAWLTFSQGNTLIEVLKGYLKSLERKEAASDGIVRPCEDRKPG